MKHNWILQDFDSCIVKKNPKQTKKPLHSEYEIKISLWSFQSVRVHSGHLHDTGQSYVFSVLSASLSQRPSCRLSGSPEAQLWPGSGNPNPYYLPHYSKLHNGDLFPGFKHPPTPLPQIKPACVETYTYSTYPTLSSVCLFMPASFLSVVQTFSDQVSTGLCLSLFQSTKVGVHTRHSHKSMSLHLHFHHFDFF